MKLLHFIFLSLSSLPFTQSFAAAPAPIPFELIDNRVFIDAYVNGQGPYKFMVDTGASFGVSKELADHLGLKLRDPFFIGGVGKNQQQAWWSDIDQFQSGNVEAEHQAFVVTSFDPVKIAIGFKQWDGLIGDEVLNQYVTKIDYGSSQITFIPPTDFKYEGSGQTLPLTFYQDTLPVIAATVDGIAGQFDIDTGDRSSLTLMRPFIDQHALRNQYQPQIEAMSGWGIGGPVPATMVRTHSFQLSSEDALAEVVTRLPSMAGGFFDNADLAGSIGGGVLKHFNVIFNYPQKQLILERNQNYSLPDNYDRAGMWLIQSGSRFQVYSLVANGPAEKVGLHVGDMIDQIDDANTSTLFLPNVREMLAEPFRKTVRVNQLEILLADQI